MLNHLVLSVSFLILICGSALADTVHVTSADDSGDSTFRAAVMAANANTAIDTIEFDSGLDITLEEEIHYYGVQDLALIGNDSAITGDCEPAETWYGGLFASYSAADISISDLSFEYSCNNGIAVFIPEDASGEVGIILQNVSVTESRFHGLYVDGQDSAGSYNTDDIPHADCNDPHPFDSTAGILLDVANSTISGNGTLAPNGSWNIPEPVYDGDNNLIGLTGCPADFDGVRVDEGGDGSIIAIMHSSSADYNLADGIEYDERGNGDVLSRAYDLSVYANGDTSAYEIYDAVNNETISDLDDGFDIDEDGNGNLFAEFEEVIVSDNRDEGLDLDEAGNGSATVVIATATANGNEDQGIKIDESDNGSLWATIDDAVTNNSISQNGMEFTEEDNGSLEVDISNTLATGNDDAAVAGEQDARGHGLIRVSDSDLKGNGDPSFDVTNIDIDLNNTLFDE